MLDISFNKALLTPIEINNFGKEQQRLGGHTQSP